MFSADTMTNLLSGPWVDRENNVLPVHPLPGLQTDLIELLQHRYPGVMTPQHEALLKICSGLADTAIGHIDFTGSWFPVEPCKVFRPCMTLAIDDSGRRWIAEVGTRSLPGPVWCVFREPEVAVYISDDLCGFIQTLRDRTCHQRTREWLRDLRVEAVTVWALRHPLAHRPSHLRDSDEHVRAWLAELPMNAAVYDLRRPALLRGFPYGLGAASGQQMRCGRLPIFAVASSPSQGWYQTFSLPVAPLCSGATAAEPSVIQDSPQFRRKHCRPTAGSTSGIFNPQRSESWDDPAMAA